MMPPHLDTGIADVADLLAVELLPLFAVKLLDKGDDVLWSHHVDESIAHVALVLEVDGQIKEIICAAELLVNCGQKHFLRVLVWDVLDHERGALVLACSRSSRHTIRKSAFAQILRQGI